MKQIKYTILYILFPIAGIFSSCNTILEDSYSFPDSEKTMKIAVTRSLGSTVIAGKLILWKAKPGDYTTVNVNDLNAYSIEKLNTGKPYPKDNSTVYISGFSPMDMQASSSYQTLNMPVGASPGTVDVCTSNTVNGNASSPFNETMTFKHTLTKIIFKARRHETMTGIRNVGNITITIPMSYLPTEWNWNNAPEEMSYQVNSSKHATSNLTLTHPDIIFENNTEEIGTCFLMLPVNNIGKLQSIRLTADIKLINSVEIDKRIDSIIDIQLMDTNNQPINKAQAGESYEILFNFQQNSFTLIASQLDGWEKGGLIYVPVKP
ncbi:fimbrillin family protein [Bacteroides sp.]|uniref:fimbrillin family protein n=1 Tax=Bacteroides sp. TaxID=29523 RepID=UPI002FCA13DB